MRIVAVSTGLLQDRRVVSPFGQIRAVVTAKTELGPFTRRPFGRRRGVMTVTETAIAYRHRPVHIRSPIPYWHQEEGIVPRMGMVAVEASILSGLRMIAPLGQVRAVVAPETKRRGLVQ